MAQDPAEPFVRAVGARLRRLREAADITQDELGRRSNVTAKFISEVENGRTNPSIGVIGRLSAGLNLPLSVFFAEEQPDERGADLAEMILLVSGESSESRKQALRVLRALFNK